MLRATRWNNASNTMKEATQIFLFSRSTYFIIPWKILKTTKHGGSLDIREMYSANWLDLLEARSTRSSVTTIKMYRFQYLLTSGLFKG